MSVCNPSYRECVKRTSLGSLSEASDLFDANLIAPLINELAKKAIPLEKDPTLKKLQQTLVAVDGTLLPALPKMLWALWLNDQHRAAKLHLEFDILKSTPTNAKITDANSNEKTVLREFLSPNKYPTPEGSVLVTPKRGILCLAPRGGKDELSPVN
ncbi:MAG: hypothetical protein ACE5IH_10560 [Thermodesulfobacteriota bacterium]